MGARPRQPTPQYSVYPAIDGRFVTTRGNVVEGWLRATGEWAGACCASSRLPLPLPVVQEWDVVRAIRDRHERDDRAVHRRAVGHRYYRRRHDAAENHCWRPRLIVAATCVSPNHCLSAERKCGQHYPTGDVETGARQRIKYIDHHQYRRIAAAASASPYITMLPRRDRPRVELRLPRVRSRDSSSFQMSGGHRGRRHDPPYANNLPLTVRRRSKPSRPLRQPSAPRN